MATLSMSAYLHAAKELADAEDVVRHLAARMTEALVAEGRPADHVRNWKNLISRADGHWMLEDSGTMLSFARVPLERDFAAAIRRWRETRARVNESYSALEPIERRAALDAALPAAAG